MKESQKKTCEGCKFIWQSLPALGNLPYCTVGVRTEFIKRGAIVCGLRPLAPCFKPMTYEQKCEATAIIRERKAPQ